MIKHPRTVCCRLSNEEWEAFDDLCQKKRISYNDMFRAIIIDALYDEGYDALRCEQSTGCEDSAEAIETCGAATA
jgi:hypothetical protein